MRPSGLLASLWLVTGALLPFCVALAQPLGGVVVRLEAYEGPAVVVGQLVGRHRLRIDVDPKSETKGLLIRVELPQTGRDAWSSPDVEVRDARGEAIAARRSGIEWHKLLIPVPALQSAYIVQEAVPEKGGPQRTTEKERQLKDPATGLSISVARWYGGRQAALSLRFDDSHPTHLTKVIPVLREYGYRGTFMINPGPDGASGRQRWSFQMHRAEWEAVAKRGDQEFANHSAHHRGAIGDDDMDAEVGGAARAIWQLTPGRSKLTALNLGGGTQWTTSRTLRHYLDKYHHFDASGGSLGMDDTYGNRVNAFRQHLERHIERKGWCRAHFHYVGDGLSSSEASFRAALDIVKEHEAELWVAGMADIHKYQVESGTVSLRTVESAEHRLVFRLSCGTDPRLYDQPLTVEVTPPPDWPAARTRMGNSQGKAVALRRVDGQAVMRCEIPPRDEVYIIELGD